MSLKRIVFIPRALAQDLVPDGRALISVHDLEIGALVPTHPWPNLLSLSFFDVDVDTSEKPAMTADHAAQALAFAQKMAPEVDELVVHCTMGQSRSAGMAFFLSEWFEVPCYKEGQRLTDNFNSYNRLVYRRMFEAAYGRGESAFGVPDACESSAQGHPLQG